MPVSNLNITRGWQDGIVSQATHFNDAITDIQTWTQQSFVNNMNQFRTDLFGTATIAGVGQYDWSNAATAQLVFGGQYWPLANPYVAVKMSATAAPLHKNRNDTTVREVSASYRLIVSPPYTGRYMVEADMVYRCSATSTELFETKFYLIKKTPSDSTLCTYVCPFGVAGSGGFITEYPLHLSCVVTFTSTAVATLAIHYSTISQGLAGAPASLSGNSINTGTNASYNQRTALCCYKI